MKKTTEIHLNPSRHSGAGRNPAKQNAAQRTKPLPRDARNTSTNWIPACAGMTDSRKMGETRAIPILRPAFRITGLILALAAIGLSSLPTTDAYANPQGGQVVAGSATIVQETAAKVGITQTTDKAIIDWQKYSIGTNEHVQYYQPSAASVTLNRVVGQDPSQILGRLTANGQVFLVNPNGIFFGKNAQIDVAGLVASTHNIRNEDFLAGKYNFNIPGNPGAAVINEGNIRIADTGIAAFVAPSVANRGVIAARLGKIMLASANGFTLDFTGDELITFLVNDSVAQTAFDLEGKQLTSFVENAGRIEAQGGYVLLTAKAAENVVHSVINQSGSIEATTVGTHNGTIILNAGPGSLSVAGALDASAPTLPYPASGRGAAGEGVGEGNGGFIETSGAHVTIDPGAKITTAAPFGKTGHWLIDPTDYTIAASGGDITGAALASYLAASNIEIQTLATGSSGNGDIFVNNAVTWNNTNKLTLTAHRNININAVINAAGGGSVKLRADSLGAGTGTVAFGGSGHITVNNGAAVGIYYNPVSYTDAATKSDTNGNPYSNFLTLNSSSYHIAYMLVSNVNQLQAINTNLFGKYALGKDIDASATAGWNSQAGFVPIGGEYNFFGSFNGLGHTINNLFINRALLTSADNYVGLFTSLLGNVSNVGLVGGSITGGALGAGSLVGLNLGAITNVFSTLNVTGIGSASYVDTGGLVGINRGAINNSYATGVVVGGGGAVNSNGGTTVGGLVGWNDNGTITSSFSTGSVSNGAWAGGLVGANGIFNHSGSILNSYSSGAVSGTGIYVGGLVGQSGGTITNSYWDTITSGQTTSGGGTGLTTVQMRQQASFSGWDFTNTWQINNGNSSPTLKITTVQPGTVLTPGSTPSGNLTPAQTLIIQQHQNDNPSMLLIAIGNGLFANSTSDPVWVGLYQNGAATQAQITANSLYPTYALYKSATTSKLLEGLTNGSIVHGGTIWTALGSSNQANRNAAYNTYTSMIATNTTNSCQPAITCGTSFPVNNPTRNDDDGTVVIENTHKNQPVQEDRTSSIPNNAQRTSTGNPVVDTFVDEFISGFETNGQNYSSIKDAFLAKPVLNQVVEDNAITLGDIKLGDISVYDLLKNKASADRSKVMALTIIDDATQFSSEFQESSQTDKIMQNYSKELNDKFSSYNSGQQSGLLDYMADSGKMMGDAVVGGVAVTKFVADVMPASRLKKLADYSKYTTDKVVGMRAEEALAVGSIVTALADVGSAFSDSIGKGEITSSATFMSKSVDALTKLISNEETSKAFGKLSKTGSLAANFLKLKDALNGLQDKLSALEAVPTGQGGLTQGEKDAFKFKLQSDAVAAATDSVLSLWSVVPPQPGGLTEIVFDAVSAINSVGQGLANNTNRIMARSVMDADKRNQTVVQVNSQIGELVVNTMGQLVESQMAD